MSIYECKSCKVISDRSESLCKPEELKGAQCDFELTVLTEDEPHICRPILDSVQVHCASCGRATTDERLLCWSELTD